MSAEPTDLHSKDFTLQFHFVVLCIITNIINHFTAYVYSYGAKPTKNIRKSVNYYLATDQPVKFYNFIVKIR